MRHNGAGLVWVLGALAALLAISILVLTTGTPHSAARGGPPQDLHCPEEGVKIENPGNSYTYTAPAGQIVTKVCIKAGNANTDWITQDGTYDITGSSGMCYKVTGINTSSVTIDNVGSGRGCPAISYIRVVVGEPTPTPTPTSMPTPTPEPTPTPMPTPTPTPTPTSTPTSTLPPAQETPRPPSPSPTMPPAQETPRPPSALPRGGGEPPTGGASLWPFVATLLSAAMVMTLAASRLGRALTTESAAQANALPTWMAKALDGLRAWRGRRRQP